MNRFLNRYEEITYRKMKPLCEQNGAHVFAKVRLVDAIHPTRRHLSSSDLSFALRSHLDFLVVSERRQYPLFAVEFDGPQHNREPQKSRDRVKNRLCDRCMLPLLRTNGGFLDRKYRGLDLLTYFLEVWFLNEAFDEGQEHGLISWEEDFDPTFIFTLSEHRLEWPYWLSLDINKAVHDMHKKGLVRDPIISYWCGEDAEHNSHCLSWICVSEGRFVLARAGMHVQDFPVSGSDVLNHTNSFEIYDRLTEVLRGQAHPRSEAAFLQLLKFYQNTYSMMSSATYGHPLAR